MSMRIPFSLPLNVGGNSENRLKYTVSPARLARSKVTRKVLSMSGALAVGFRVVEKLIQPFEEAAETVFEDEARTWPLEPTKETVIGPLKVDPEENLKLKEAL